MAWQATPTPAPVIERIASGVAVVAGRVGGPRRIADDLFPINGSNVYILAPDGEIDQLREV
jgi:glycosyltransferase involved in cell wall biosynthesis